MARLVAQRVAATPPARRRRTLEERGIVKYPGAFARFARLATRLPAHSRLRRTLVRRATASAFAAVSRGDIELWVSRYAPDAVHEWSSGLVSLGFPERASGHAELFRAMSEWDAAWERWTMTQFFILDLGDRLVLLNKIAGRTRDAGVDVDIAHAAINEIPEGLVVRERDFNDWETGLRAAGIDPVILSRLDALATGETLVD